MEKFYRQALRILQETTDFETFTLRHYDAASNSFRLMAQKGMSPKMVAELENLPADSGFHAEIMQTHFPTFTVDMANDPRVASTEPAREGFRSMVCLPMLAQDTLVGSIQLVTREARVWDREELNWFAQIGRRFGLLIHQIQLSERLRDMAVLEERSRLAQEIHDGLAQMVGAMRLWSEEALLSLEQNRIDQVERTLRRIQFAARDTYASLRVEILGLRDSIFPEKDFESIVAEFLRRFQRQWGIKTHLQLDKTFTELMPLSLSPNAEIQLLRIIQEGVTNVRRHANAHNIGVEISSDNHSLKIRIEDDGSGFDQTKIPEDRLGLRIMRERAASIGGGVTIETHLGQGTQLEILVPLSVPSQKTR